ncbi:hypothetical protein H0G86_003541 [Trichoderma simmonsii]|uniref:Uncharacterized protein n=1 Tax=Trichoderma simmonsii TaxID=1491479 RepID=A0A8G0PCM0_9HYPO|nr:hypothetical protein H0G86_003541 [Trichoderma simmonsii]
MHSIACLGDCSAPWRIRFDSLTIIDCTWRAYWKPRKINTPKSLGFELDITGTCSSVRGPVTTRSPTRLLDSYHASPVFANPTVKHFDVAIRLARPGVGEGHWACLITPYTHECFTEPQPRPFTFTHSRPSLVFFIFDSRRLCEVDKSSHEIRLQLTHKGTDIHFLFRFL